VPPDRPLPDTSAANPREAREPEPDAARDEKRRLYHQMLALVTRLAEDQQRLRDEMQRHVRV
jgi:hypothetical protein